MKNIPIIKLDYCVLPYCSQYINLSDKKNIVEYAYKNKLPILLVFEENIYGTLFCPENTQMNINIVTSDIAKITSNPQPTDSMPLVEIDHIHLQVTNECFEYKSKILEILELIYNSQDDISKVNMNNILFFIQKQNMLNNLNHFSIEKFAFVVYDQLFNDPCDKYFALLQNNFLKIYKMCFVKIKEIFLENQETNLINKKIQNKIQEYHKKLFLQEKISTLNEELGSKNEYKELEKLIEKLPDKPRKAAIQELKRLEKMPGISSEGAIIRNYINWLIDLPWGKKKVVERNMNKVKEIINDSHMGLNDVKHQIQLLLVSKLRNPDVNNAPILLCGPPGVGKTSIVEAISRALDLPHRTISLCGLNDSTVLLGTMRAYLGAVPGKFIQTMKKLGCINGIIHLDEVDKMGNDMLRSPMNVLVAILDPTQNHQFQDLYLDVEFDFKKTQFILTANSTEGIPSAILNRVNVINIPGYSLEEKKKILPKLLNDTMKELSVTSDEFSLSSNCHDYIISNYTCESGVRQLSMVIKNILQNVLLKLECNKKEKININKKNLNSFVNREPIVHYKIKNYPGCCTGLAWTNLGGKICPIESVIKTTQNKKLVITGNLGQIMQESVKVAVSCLSKILDKHLYESYIHLHAPEGGIPKDGPSAGITIFSALYSYVHNITLPEHLAMTGELTLSGKITAIGGLKEKLTAAIQHGITKVLIPIDNSLQDIPSDLKNKLHIVQISSVDQLISHLR